MKRIGVTLLGLLIVAIIGSAFAGLIWLASTYSQYALLIVAVMFVTWFGWLTGDFAVALLHDYRQQRRCKRGEHEPRRPGDRYTYCIRCNTVVDSRTKS